MVGFMAGNYRADRIDARLLLALATHPRATTIALADETALSRNTVQARLSRMDEHGGLKSFERRIDPNILGYPLTAFIQTSVRQRMLAEVAEELNKIPELLEVHGLSGGADLLIHVVARDADDLYRVAGLILSIKGVKRTRTSLVMRKLVDYRITGLLRQLADED
jgi:DNA-binding Lrp family transcriptional regulator